MEPLRPPLLLRESAMDTSHALVGQHDYRLVLASVLVAILASYATLSLADCMTAANERPERRRAWWLAGTIAMGAGVWAMHFIGMLAFSLPVPVSYDILISLISLIPALLAGAQMLHLIAQPVISPRSLLLGGGLMGAGVVVMHFTGMAALRLPATMHYDPVLLALSLFIAVQLSISALYAKTVAENWKARYTGMKWERHIERLLQLGGAVILGAAVSGMHYTAMAATYFFPAEPPAPATEGWDYAFMAVAIGLVATCVVGLAIVSTMVDARLRAADRLVRANRTHLMEAIDNLEEGYVLFDERDCFVMCNSAFARMHRTIEECLEPGIPYEIFLRSWAQRRPELNGNLDGTEEWVRIRLKSHAVDSASYEDVLPTGRYVLVTERRTAAGGRLGIWLDITMRIAAKKEREALERELNETRKLEAIGQLAGGIAHEINTPIQYIGTNLRYLEDVANDLRPVLELCLQAAETGTDTGGAQAYLAQLAKAVDDVDIEFAIEETPKAVRQSLHGVEQVSRIVLAMKEFSHPGPKDGAEENLNKAIENALAVARNEWKHVATAELDLDPDLPLVDCRIGELNQVFLNLFVNAAHAIKDADGDMGTLTVTSRRIDDTVEIRITDTGTGIPPEIRDQVFNPFFTTKEVGKGTGQGLSIAYDIVVNKHYGSLTFETEAGVGTTFVIRLPISVKTNGHSADHGTNPHSAEPTAESAGAPVEALHPPGR